MSGNKFRIWSLLAVLLVIVASSSLKSVLTEQAFAAEDGGGSGGGGGDGGGVRHHHHHHHRNHSGSSTSNNFQATGVATSTAGTPKAPGFSFKEVLEVSPSLKGVVMTSATNKFVDSGGTMHIVGEVRNDAAKTLNVNQMVATIYGLNNQTIGLDYANPIPKILSPGQSASFEFLVGGDQPADGINDLSQIGKVKYHVGL
jgi:hypothetical protein